MTPKVKKLCDDIEELKERLVSGESEAEIAREYGIHRNTLDKCLRNSEKRNTLEENQNFLKN